MLKLFVLIPVLLILLLVLICLGEWSYISIRNYYGYCTYSSSKNKDFRGRRFTTEERRDIAINHYLRNQISMDHREIERAELLSSVKDQEKRFTLIPYADKDEFLQANPGCCKRSWGMEGVLEGDRFWRQERAEGYGDGMFNFRHKVRYMSQEGVRKEIETTNTYIIVFNCGVAKNRFYHGKVLDPYDLPKVNRPGFRRGTLV